MPDSAAIKETVEAYVRGVASGSFDDVLSLFAEGATLQDPVGSPTHVGHAAIRAFFDANPSVESCELVTQRVAGDTAAFLLRAVIEVDDVKLQIEPLDVMTFDEDAKILSMRALWGQEDVHPL